MKKIRDIEYCHTYERKNDETIYFGYKIYVEDTDNNENEIVQIFIEKDRSCCENYGIVFYTLNKNQISSEEFDYKYIKPTDTDNANIGTNNHNFYQNANIESLKNMEIKSIYHKEAKMMEDNVVINTQISLFVELMDGSILKFIIYNFHNSYYPHTYFIRYDKKLIYGLM